MAVDCENADPGTGTVKCQFPSGERRYYLPEKVCEFPSKIRGEIG